jgi:hypothetical protein
MAQTTAVIKVALTAPVWTGPIHLARILQDSGSVRGGIDTLDGGGQWTNVACVV